MMSIMWRCSVAADLRNFLRAGVLKNRSLISTTVPCVMPFMDFSRTSPASSVRDQPVDDPCFREAIVDLLTDMMLGRASPRKPKVRMEKRSSGRPILLVAWRRIASSSSTSVMPLPLSAMRIRSRPLPPISTSMFVAPASMAFSKSSLTTDAGRSMTSPAAI